MTPTIQVAPAARGQVSSDMRRGLARSVSRSARRFGFHPAHVTLRVVGEEEMAALKEAHMGEAHATDVLSFPSPAGDGGDIALCWPVVVAQAAAMGCAPREEAVRLVVHGLAHLAGHDHGTPAEARRMLRAERRALRRLGVPDVMRPYTPGVM